MGSAIVGPTMDAGCCPLSSPGNPLLQWIVTLWAAGAGALALRWPAVCGGCATCGNPPALRRRATLGSLR